MRRPPRARDAPILTGALVWHIALVSLLFLAGIYGVFAYALDRGHDLDVARSMALNTLVVLKIFHLFFVRNLHGTALGWAMLRGTGVVWVCVILACAAQAIITYVPPMHRVFGTAPVPPGEALLIIGVGVVFFALIETEKQMRLALRANLAGPGP